MSDRTTPTYSELPRLANGLAASWGVFGDDDELGTANLLTPDAVLRAVGEVKTGARINITLPLNEPNPTYFGRNSYQHSFFETNDSFRDDYLDGLYLQASTNWDGFRHKRDPDLGFYNGVHAEGAVPAGNCLGVGAFAQQGIIGRGVLVDVARNGGIEDYDPLKPIPFDRDVLARTLENQSQSLQPGDILLVRTGFMDAYLAADPIRRLEIRDRGLSAGLAADDGVAEFLWDNQIAAVAVDNPGVEYGPEVVPDPDLHARLIPMLGLVIGEFFDFRELSTICEDDRRYTSFFVSVPLNVPGGVGSPGNAIVIR